MGLFNRNHFPVDGRTVLITGASQGMGKSVGRLLAEKGASVVIVARGVEKLQEAIAYICSGAAHPKAQRFHYISADCTVPAQSARIMSEVTTWNHGQPPDVVWCIAGAARPGMFVDAPVDSLRQQMDVNFFSAAYLAHAALNAWLKPAAGSGESAATSTTPGGAKAAPEARHLIFTASFLALYSMVGYTPYAPGKSALRSLADGLSQEMQVYAGARPDAPRVRVHTVFPATIFSEGLELENRVKPDVTKKIEEDDPGQTPDEAARASVAGLERGEELVATSWQTWLVMCSVLGGSVRNGLGVLQTLASWLVSIVLPLVRWDHDTKTRKWGAEHGPSGMKRA